MIDEKTLAEDEREQKMLADHYANKPEMVVTFKKRIAVIRNARRYLALRNAAKTQEGRVKVQAIFWHMASRKDIDAAADRLLAQAALAVPNLVESHQIKAPDCRTCANRGRVNGLSQESYCDSCVYQGRDWRQNHFVDASKMVDAVKRRCEACAILPCSCK